MSIHPAYRIVYFETSEEAHTTGQVRQSKYRAQFVVGTLHSAIVPAMFKVDNSAWHFHLYRLFRKRNNVITYLRFPAPFVGVRTRKSKTSPGEINSRKRFKKHAHSSNGKHRYLLITKRNLAVFFFAGHRTRAIRTSDNTRVQTTNYNNYSLGALLLLSLLIEVYVFLPTFYVF